GSRSLMSSPAEQPPQSQPTGANRPEGAAAAQPAVPPPRLNLPSRLSDQVPGLATYQPNTGAHGSSGASGALRTSDRDRKETRKVRTMLVSVGMFVMVVLGAVILAGSHSQPSADERQSWNSEEIEVIQRVLLRTSLPQYQKELSAPEANGEPAKAVQAIVTRALQTDLDRVTRFLETAECQSDADQWNHKRREKYILERAIGWIDGYDRPFRSTAKGLRLTVLSMGANGRVDTAADTPRDDLSATVSMPSGKPMEVAMWDDVFTLPDMSQVEIFDPADPKSMEKLRSMDPEHLSPRERQMERRYSIENLMDESVTGNELSKKLNEYEKMEGLPQPGDWKARVKPDTDGKLPSTPGGPGGAGVQSPAPAPSPTKSIR
ncbi:MAG TPA: hypothetical protein VL860_09630, partial [Planctomycetota bacterium]|nr:hypothetical protein [Planctomycetota bacterium]